MNNKFSTYVHPATGMRSSLDLAFVDPTLYLDYNWAVNDDLCGSDHYPIFFKSHVKAPPDDIQRWKLLKANWPLFTAECSSKLSFDSMDLTADPIEAFATNLIKIADTTIPKTSNKPRPISNPWFNDNCSIAIADRKAALKKFNKNPTPENLNAFKILRAKARRTIKSSKRDSWRSFVSQLTCKTPMKKIWNMVRRISGKTTRSPTHHLKINGSTIDEPKEIANTLASTISQNSSSDHYSDEFRRFKSRKEKYPLKFDSDNTETYNEPFSMAELQAALHKAHDTAVGPDNIHYQMLKHLPESALDTLLNIFNDIWITGNFRVAGLQLQSSQYPNLERTLHHPTTTDPSHSPAVYARHLSA